MKIFKFPTVTYLTSSVFESLIKQLEQSVSVINSKKTHANLTQQYNFFFLLRVLSCNFQALNFCKLSLPNILQKEALYKQFLDVYQKCIVQIVESGYLQDFEAGDHQEEMKNLWVDIYQLSLRIISNSLNLIYSDNAEILKNLVVILKKAATESKQAENSALLLTYLSDIENVKKLVGTDAEQFNLTQSVVQSCC